MKNKTNLTFLLNLIFLFGLVILCPAQTTEPEEIVAKTDDFENSFFEAINSF